jgi:tRNA A-37 threonylcarbamoyl transferase component Bud32
VTPPASETVSAVDPRIGALLHDRYRIVRKLAEGGMGVVYEAEHVLIHRRVAVKCLHPEYARNDEVVARFQREATAAASIGNQHIIEVTDMGLLHDGSYFMVLEFLEGCDVEALILEGGPLPVGRAVHLLTQVCDALSAAHAKGIVHRDLKPANLYVTPRGDDPYFVKVLDFGISKFRDADEGGVPSLTRTGTMMGTPHYMAPEQVQSARSVDHRADIYALGAIAYELLTGRCPHDDETLHLLIYRICSQPIVPVGSLRLDLPDGLSAVVMRMLARDPAERFQDCAAVRRALAPYAGLDGAPRLNPEAPTPALALDGSLPPPTPFGSTALATPASAPTVVASRVRPSVVAAGVAASSLAVLALVVSLWPRAPQPAIAAGPSPTPAALAPTVVAPAAVAPAVAPAVAAPERRTHVALSAQPDDAEVLLDGRRIANPFDGELPASAELHRLEVRRRGYTAVVQDLSLEYPQVVRIRLHRGAGVDDQRRVRSAPLGVAPAEVAPAVAAAPTPRERPAEPSPEASPQRPPEEPPPPRPAAIQVAPGVVAPPAAQQLRHVEL